MAKSKNTASRGWIKHIGKGRPAPIGTLIEVERFCGLIETIRVGLGGFRDENGRPISNPIMTYSAWDYGDGGPIGPKIRQYRIMAAQSRTQSGMAVLRSLLNQPHKEVA